MRRTVDSLIITLISAVCIFAGALLGMGLQRRLPKQHLSNEMQDLVKLSAGTIATLTALVLGLLVSSAKSSYDEIKTGIVQGSAKFILLDRTLARYGPEANPVREQLKLALAGAVERVWPTEKTGITVLTALERAHGMELVQDKLGELTPKNETQRLALAQSQQIVNDLSQTRWLLIEEAQNQLPVPFLVILIFWLVLLFVSFGLFAPRNSMALAVLFLVACSLSAAIFLVLELNQPLAGLMKVSDAPLLNAMQNMGQ
ncbi:MAG TPA: hypothetical protein VMF08_04360 [Candidatus Sulfotelmatobacter sp.]|nr:hypothetical protein [Candidatus Sulfotelmatobacter sp.]